MYILAIKMYKLAIMIYILDIKMYKLAIKMYSK